MAADRPEKVTMRRLWLEVLHRFALEIVDESPLYLTLPGGEGKDIQMLVEAGLLELSETGSVVDRHRRRVIAVESNSQALVSLRRRFPGLTIREQPFENLVRSDSQFRWPEGEDAEFCKARVVNLDLNACLDARVDDGELKIPIFAWIQKLCQLHKPKRISWSLCLTLHGEVHWTLDASGMVRDFLCENFKRDESFASACADLLGEEVCDAIRRRDSVDFAAQGVDMQQRILMVFVPKRIAHTVHADGWRVNTLRNLRYGGTGARAPIVSWILDIIWEPQAFRQPETVYRESLSKILVGAGRIEENGTLS